MNERYAATEPTRDEVDALDGVTLIEFGAPWCGFCQAAQPLLARTLGERPHVRHLKIEDGRGRRLGRSFAIKLWPTLVILRDGREIARLVRPTRPDAVREALAAAEADLPHARHAPRVSGRA